MRQRRKRYYRDYYDFYQYHPIVQVAILIWLSLVGMFVVADIVGWL